MGTPPATNSPAVHRVEVHPSHGDPRGEALVRAARRLGMPLSKARTARVYLLQAPFSSDQLARLERSLLADPITEKSFSPTAPAQGTVIEIHPLPGVMDPAAQSVKDAIRDLLGVDAGVSTGWRYDLTGLSPEECLALAQRTLANPVVHQVHAAPWHPATLPRGQSVHVRQRQVPLRDLSDQELASLSRSAHLFLSLDEMRALQSEYHRLGREPWEIELETIAQTWSEHCVHKTLKSTIRYEELSDSHASLDWSRHPLCSSNPDGSVTIHNLLKATVAAATHELIHDGVDWTLSVFTDNSGVIALDERFGVCIKVETHNHPSAIEPYGGAATGIGGCIRDVIGTGLSAKPIASTDVFCVAHPGSFDTKPLPPGTLHPRRILTDVVAGVRDYGNRMGIPTVNGAVFFDDRYVGNPLVFCGCVGLIPKHLVRGKARSGDRIIALGGRTGRDGIHGATFSSAQMEESHADEFAHAVQIGNAIEEKRTLDALLRAREPAPGLEPLFHAITDCGAGGFSSAVGEMGSGLGAQVDLDKAPLKYAGLTPTEIWISEAQERFVLAVPPENLPALRRICEEEHVELADLGFFGTEGERLTLRYQGSTVGELSMAFLHEGIPTPTRRAAWRPPAAPAAATLAQDAPPLNTVLPTLLAHPSIASKHWIIRQYDHEVQGNTVVKPLTGPAGIGPSDASVLEPVAGSGRGIAIACGMQTPTGDTARGGDPYVMALSAIDECVRNLVCVGADPDHIAILDNFCWPSCQDEHNLAALVRASRGCYDAAKAYRTPFVSGKDSLNNQLAYTDPATGEQRLVQIPYTLLITGLGIVPEMARVITMDAKAAGNLLVLAGAPSASLGGSCYQELFPQSSWLTDARVPRPSLTAGPAAARAVAHLIAHGLVRSAHDCSEGGMLTAIAEMLIAASGAKPSLGFACDFPAALSPAMLIAEAPSCYVLEVEPARLEAVRRDLGKVPLNVLGRLTPDGRLVSRGNVQLDLSVDELTRAWRSTLDW